MEYAGTRNVSHKVAGSHQHKVGGKMPGTNQNRVHISTCSRFKPANSSMVLEVRSVVPLGGKVVTKGAMGGTSGMLVSISASQNGYQWI